MKSERKSKGMSTEEARALLAKNPALRAHGRDTQWVQERVDKAWGKGPAASTAPTDFFELVTAMKRELAALERGLKERELVIERERARALDEVRARLSGWLDEADPERAHPLTKRVLERERAFFNKLSFDK